LPLWHGVTKSVVLEYSPSLANIVAIQTDGISVEQIAVLLADKLGVYRYYANNNARIKRSTKKYPISTDSREHDFQVIHSNQSFRIINKRESQACSEFTLAPFSVGLNEHPFHYWQSAKGEIELVRHVAYEMSSGNPIECSNTIAALDENRLLSILRFALRDLGPIRVIGEITTTNRFDGLFEDGLDYEEFNIKKHHSLFSYSLIV
jgi:hypothetical protein